MTNETLLRQLEDDASEALDLFNEYDTKATIYSLNHDIMLAELYKHLADVEWTKVRKFRMAINAIKRRAV